jgi:hypothetical protein
MLIQRRRFLVDDRSTLVQRRRPLLVDRRSLLTGAAALAAYSALSRRDARAGIHGASNGYPKSVVATGSQAAYNLPGSVGAGPAGGQPALTTTGSTFSLPTGWTRSSTDIYSNGYDGTVSNSDWTGFTFWQGGGSGHAVLNNILFKAPAANDDLLVNFQKSATGILELNNCTFDGNGITTRFYGFILFFSGPDAGGGGPGLVKLRYCLFQNLPWGGPAVSCPTDIQYCFFGPLSLKATVSDHTDLIFYHAGATHIFSNNLIDLTMPAQNGQTTTVEGCEGCFGDLTPGPATSVTFNNNIWRGLASYQASGGAHAGLASPWGGYITTYTVNNNAVEPGVDSYRGAMSGGTLVDGGNNRDYDSNTILNLSYP